MLVLNRVLGGSSSARLFLKLREERGYAYSASSSFSALTYRGTWRATTDVRTPVTGQAARDLYAELRRIADEPVPAGELDQAKRALVAGFAATLERPSQVVSNWLVWRLYGFSDDYWDTYPDKIMAVTAEEVQQVARKYLDADHMQIIVVGDGARVRSGLAQFGPFEEFDASGRPIRGKP